MLAHYLRIALRSLSRQKGYAAINVAGLAVGLAFCALIGLYVRDELTYDRLHERADRVFRVYRTSFNRGGVREQSDPWLPIPLGPALQADLPGVEAYARLSEGTHFVRTGREPVEQELVYADPAVFQLFTFPLLRGDARTALADPQSVVLTEAAAARYFGDADPMGRPLAIRLADRFEDFVVTGVARDVPSSSSVKFEVMVPFMTYVAATEWARDAVDEWTTSGILTYVLLREGVSAERLAAALPAFRARYYPDETARPRDGAPRRGRPAQFRLQPLADTHLNTAVGGGLEEPSDPTYSYILGGIALAVLFIACVNFTTLAVGRSASRAREVGVRKAVGAQRRQLVAQFWGEALLMSLLALLLGMGLAELFLPVFNELAGKTLAFDLAGDAGTLAGLAGLVLLTGLVAGSYPAVVLSGIRPVETLKGRFRLGGANVLTRGLVAVQFALSVFLVASTLVMLDQVAYVRTQHLGFDEEQVVVVPTDGLGGARGIARFRDAVAARPDVAGLTGMSNAFTRGRSSLGFDYQGEQKTVVLYRVEADFLDVLGIDLVAGRPFDPRLPSDSTHAVLVNEALAADFGWADPEGQVVTGMNEDPAADPTVVGVVEDFHFASLHEPVAPMMLVLSSDMPVRHLLVRIAPGDVPATLAALGAAWGGAAPGVPFQYSFLDEDLDRQYQNEERWSRIVGYASFFAVLVACLGLFGLAALTVTARTKEVGIRKVLGATATGVAVLLSKDFARLVLVGVVLAVPAAYLAMERWLEGFAYRVELGPGVFVAAGLLALLIALATVASQALRAATADPVTALRYE
jgi:putative ABC transport system permease protein